jgi:hypothetical protein
MNSVHKKGTGTADSKLGRTNLYVGADVDDGVGELGAVYIYKLFEHDLHSLAIGSILGDEVKAFRVGDLLRRRADVELVCHVGGSRELGEYSGWGGSVGVGPEGRKDEVNKSERREEKCNLEREKLTSLSHLSVTQYDAQRNEKRWINDGRFPSLCSPDHQSGLLAKIKNKMSLRQSFILENYQHHWMASTAQKCVIVRKTSCYKETFG